MPDSKLRAIKPLKAARQMSAPAPAMQGADADLISAEIRYAGYHP